MAKIARPLPLMKKKDSFILKLDKALYQDAVVHQALAEDKEWVSEEKTTSDKYYCLRLRTTDRDDVLNWMNYLIYLHKAYS